MKSEVPSADIFITELREISPQRLLRRSGRRTQARYVCHQRPNMANTNMANRQYFEILQHWCLLSWQVSQEFFLSQIETETVDSKKIQRYIMIQPSPPFAGPYCHRYRVHTVSCHAVYVCVCVYVCMCVCVYVYVCM